MHNKGTASFFSRSTFDYLRRTYLSTGTREDVFNPRFTRPEFFFERRENLEELQSRDYSDREPRNRDANVVDPGINQFDSIKLYSSSKCSYTTEEM